MCTTDVVGLYSNILYNEGLTFFSTVFGVDR